MKTIPLALYAGVAFTMAALYGSPATAQTCGDADGCDTNIYSDYSQILSGRNSVIENASEHCVISGGYSNHISYQAPLGTISGGASNFIDAYGNENTIGGGQSNYIYGGTTAGRGNDNTIGGGYNNRLTSTTSGGFIGGGRNNLMPAGDCGVIGGGDGNQTTHDYGMVGGGYHNIASGVSSAVLGGYQNTASGDYSCAHAGGGNLASGMYSAVLGGSGNVASGDYSLAVGRDAKADQNGCFVWADNAGYPMQCKIYPSGSLPFPAQNSFIARATGGVELITGMTAGTPSAGVYLTMGGSTWYLVSDRNKKRDFEPVDGREVLEKLAAIPITTWQYDGEVSGARHMGPMAQDLFAAYGLGDDDRHVTSIDEDGIAMASIQGLYTEMTETDETMRALTDREAAAEAEAASIAKSQADAHRRAAAVEKELAEIAASLGIPVTDAAAR